MLQPQLSNWECYNTLPIHSDAVRVVAISYDGQLLASRSDDTTLQLYNLKTPCQPIILADNLEREYQGYGLTFSPNSPILAIESDKNVHLWNVITRQNQVLDLGLSVPICSLAFSPNGQLLAAGSFDGMIGFWDLTSNQPLPPLKAHFFPIWSLAFSPDGLTLASGSGDGTVGLWSLDHRHSDALLVGHSFPVWSVAFSPDGLTLATGSEDKTIKLWWLEIGQELVTFLGHTGTAESLVFSPNGKILVSASQDQTLKLWQISPNLQVGNQSDPIQTLTGHTGGIGTVAYSPSEDLIVSGSTDGTIKLWRQGGVGEANSFY
jgi:WD40 repeat protein